MERDSVIFLFAIQPRSNAITRVLCLVPTRELGVQVYTVTKQLASFSNEIQVSRESISSFCANDGG